MNSRNYHIHWILFALFFSWWEIGIANIIQEPGDTVNSETEKHLKETDNFFKKYPNSSVVKDSLDKLLNLEDAEINIEFDSITKLKYLEAYRGLFENNIRNYEHSQQVFKWQLTSSKLIFITVIILVMAGIVFSGLQFKRGTSDSKTEFEFSRHGFKVSSSILGVIILVISLAFFYLYLVYVYPIQEIF